MDVRRRTGPRTGRPRSASDKWRWWALAVIALGMLMGVVDVTIVNVALPSIGKALQVTGTGRQWVVTAYTVAFAGFLLIGGRAADRIGRRRAFLIGVAGFAAASAAGGAAGNLGILVTARASQGMFAALLAPTALSLVAATFPDLRERGRAFAVFGLVMSGGAGAGLILGGVFTQCLGWRWAFYINIPLALTAIAGALAVLAGDRPRTGTRIDWAGAVTGTAGLAAVVYGLSLIPAHGWLGAPTAGALAAGAALLMVFTLAEARAREPLLPLRVIAHRSRGGTYLAFALVMIAMFGMFLLVSFYLQTVRNYTALQAGAAFLPFAGATFIASALVARTITRLPPRALLAAGLLLAAAGMGWLTQLHAGSTYPTIVLPALLVIGAGVGTLSPVAANLATFEVAERDTGVASAMFNVAEQAGASLGLTLLNTIAVASTSTYLAARQHAPAAHLAGLVHGYTTATGWAAAILGAGALAVLLLVNAQLRGSTSAAAAPAHSPAKPEAESPAAGSSLTTAA